MPQNSESVFNRHSSGAQFFIKPFLLIRQEPTVAVGLLRLRGRELSVKYTDMQNHQQIIFCK